MNKRKDSNSSASLVKEAPLASGGVLWNLMLFWISTNTRHAEFTEVRGDYVGSPRATLFRFKEGFRAYFPPLFI